jgi:NADP-dependent 3-hydroxy acid dehydrogenase YdfG
VLLNNAGIAGGKHGSWEGLANWKQLFDVNFFGRVDLASMNYLELTAEQHLERAAYICACYALPRKPGHYH